MYISHICKKSLSELYFPICAECWNTHMCTQTYKYQNTETNLFGKKKCLKKSICFWSIPNVAPGHLRSVKQPGTVKTA